MWHDRNDTQSIAFCTTGKERGIEFEQSDDMWVAMEFRGNITYGMGFCRRYEDGRVAWSTDSEVTGCKVVGWQEIEPFQLSTTS